MTSSRGLGLIIELIGGLIWPLFGGYLCDDIRERKIGPEKYNMRSIYEECVSVCPYVIAFASHWKL